MLHNKLHHCLAGFDKVNAITIFGSAKKQFVVIGLKFVHLPAENVEDADCVQVFAFEGYEIAGRIGVKAQNLFDFLYSFKAFMLLASYIFQCIDNSLCVFNGIEVTVGYGVVGVDDDYRRIEDYRDALRDAVAATGTADGGVCDSEHVGPSAAFFILVLRADLDVEHIVLVAAEKLV